MGGQMGTLLIFGPTGRAFRGFQLDKAGRVKRFKSAKDLIHDLDR